MNGFTVEHRNKGHWDIYQNKRRIYQIRGERGSVLVYNNSLPEPVFRGKTVTAAMVYVCDILMGEEE